METPSVEEKKKTELKSNWFGRVPLWIRIAGVLIFIFKFMQLSAENKSMNELVIWGGIIFIVWYWFGREYIKSDHVILTPEEAITNAQNSVKFLYQSQQIERNETWTIGPNISLFHTEGTPRYYLIQAECKKDSFCYPKRAQVYAEGETKGYVCWQDVPHKMTGREAVPIARPKWMREISNYGVSIKDILTGNLKQK